ncbi:MAG: type II 3-dehydroquinate dehydratase [Porticoccaceae bacterium]
MSTILILNGPNLNLLGTREPEKYGLETLEQINQQLTDTAHASGHAATCFQSNAEHDLIQRIHDAKQEGVNYIIFNPGAYTHTSVAIRDALLGVAIPFIEVHLSNVHAREEFRRHSYFSDIADGVICGFGANSYNLALKAVVTKLELNS